MTLTRIHGLWIPRILLAACLAVGSMTALAGCEIAPSQAVCQVSMNPSDLGIIVHDGKVSGMVTVACDQPVTSIHVSINVSRDRGNSEFIPVNHTDFFEPSTDGNYVVAAPCIPGRWRFGYAVTVTANGETKRALATSDVTEVHPDDC
ncbi:MAG TPA: hypothetical protein VL551_22125 [Actinospica sp.]|nr:hypothetical protein [Actinospica sp.]